MSEPTLTPAERTEIWSCGGGTQSGAIAMLIGQGKLPKPDIAYMTDTGRERSSTWPFVEDFIKPQLGKVGLELQIVRAADFQPLDVVWNDTILVPGFTTQSGKIGKLSAFCSGKWKRDVAERYFRSIGVRVCRNWIGISLDEMKRVRAKHRPWIDLYYPLIETLPMRRQHCVDLIRTEWAGEIPHSACWCCSNASDEEWQALSPDDFGKACDLEDEVRAVDPHFWLHPSCVPLRQVDFENWRKAEDTGQMSMIAEHGCTGGCFT